MNHRVVALWLSIVTLLVLCTSCSHRVHEQAFSFRLVADTLRQGGLEILHNIAIIDEHGTVLFTDSTEEFEPDHFSVLVPDSTIQSKRCYLLLMLFDPCEDRTLVLQYDEHSITPYGIFPTDSIHLP